MYCKPKAKLAGKSLMAFKPGLAGDDEIQKEYGGQSKAGQLIVPQVDQLLNPPMFDTSYGIAKKPQQFSPADLLKPTATAFNPFSAMGPGALMPGLDPITSSILMKTPVGKILAPVQNVMAHVTAPLQHVIGMVMGPLQHMFGGMFKKATHMESCMKWWTDSNIRSMVATLQPIPTQSAESILNAYKANMDKYILAKFEETIGVRGKYQDMLFQELGLPHLLDMGRRKARMDDIYTQILRSNPDVMTMNCAAAPKGRAETGVQFDEAYVDANFLAPMRDSAQQQEFDETNNALITTMQTKLDSIMRPVIQQQEKDVAKIQQQRDAASTFKLPEGVIGIKNNALQLEVKGGPVERRK